MAAISLKLTEALLEASGRCAKALRLTRAEYIRRAVERMNKDSPLAQRLAETSRRVRKESMRVNREFEGRRDPASGELAG